jgi:hypothetical protein
MILILSTLMEYFVMHTEELEPVAVRRDEEADSGPPVSRREQVAWSFLHRGETDLAQTNTYDVRQQILMSLPKWPHLEVSVRGSKGATTVYARTPAASAWLSEHMGEVMGAIGSITGRVIPVDSRSAVPRVRFSGRHLYYVRTLIVSRGRKSSDWDEWKAEELGDAKREHLAEVLAEGIRSELLRWSAIDADVSMGGLIVTDVGRPMPIVPSSGPRGMSRIGVKFIAPWAIDGHVFAGVHTLMGYGLVKRGGQLNATGAAEGDKTSFKMEVL